MNFLAHLHLSPETPKSWIGSLAPDLCRLRKTPLHDPEIRRAARLHQKIDVWTDTHPAFLAVKQQITPRHGRFSGILTDVFFDHILAVDWRHWHPASLSGFIQSVYGGLDRQQASIPGPMRVPVRRMIQDDWLGCYDSIEGMRLILCRMSDRFQERFNRDIDLSGGADTLAELTPRIRERFQCLYPDLMAKRRLFLETECP